MSNYDKTMRSVQAYCEIELTDLEILLESKTSILNNRTLRLPVSNLCVLSVLHVDNACIHCM